MSRFRSNVLQTFADCYAASKPGRTGQGAPDWKMDFRALLERAGCADGDARAHAIADLQEAEQIGCIKLDRHRRDAHIIERVRLSREKEAELFDRLNKKPPMQIRAELAAQFRAAASLPVPENQHSEWSTWCESLAVAASTGSSVAPFIPADTEGNSELLTLLAKLLSWQGESLLRFASCVLCGDSKRLEQLSGKLGQCLAKLTQDRITSLDDIGLLANPRTILLHGPLRIELPRGSLDLGFLRGAYRLSQVDVESATQLFTKARHCVTVENETVFHELANQHSGDLLVQTSFPGSGTLALLKRLPADMEFRHFGDADPEGFEILRDLRERTGRPFHSLHMQFRPEPAGPELTPQEKQQVQRLLKSPLLEPEREALAQMLVAGHKGAYEQESLDKINSIW